MATFDVHLWQRDPRNPIFPPSHPPSRSAQPSLPQVSSPLSQRTESGGFDGFDVGCCMNPFVLRRGHEYWLYYAGADAEGRRRICLAIASVDDLTHWQRLGPLFDLGEPGSFDEHWCVLPCLRQFGATWHLYYTGYSASYSGEGLQAFRGIGLALSEDLLHWRKDPLNPILTGDGFAQWPDNLGLAGAGNIIAVSGKSGGAADSQGNEAHTRVRMYYTLSTGHPATVGPAHRDSSPAPDIFTEQAKQSVCAHSLDGIVWEDKRLLLTPRVDCDYENIGVIGLYVWKSGKSMQPGKTPARYRAIYSAIGTRFGMYSLCEAVSDDGLTWDRGQPDENLSLAPTGSGWESEMVEYPCVVEEGNYLRLFYCGNGYGQTGIGTAIAQPIA